jgi:molybdopterin-guanine dinucleotide biosynthesis protein A
VVIIDSNKDGIATKKGIERLTRCTNCFYWLQAETDVFDFVKAAIPDHGSNSRFISLSMKRTRSSNSSITKMLQAKPKLNGLVLAGGQKPERMGQDKSAINWHQ